MHVNYLYQKVRPSYITKNPEVNIDDYGMICTLKYHHSVPFKVNDDIRSNDPLIWSLFQKAKNKNGHYEADRLFNRYVLNKFNRGSFLGFYNINDFIHYCTILFVICENFEIPEITNEMESISKVIRIVHNKKVFSLKDFFSEIRNALSMSNTINKIYSIVKQMKIETCASQVYDHFKESLAALNGDHIYLEYFGPSLVTSHVSAIHNIYMQNASCHSLSAFSNGFETPISHNTRKCSDIQDRKDSGGDFLQHKYNLPAFSFLSYAIKKPDGVYHSLDDSIETIKDVYNEKIGKLFETSNFNANFNGDIDEYVTYRKKITSSAKKLGIKTTFNKSIKSQTDDLLKVRLVLKNKSSDSIYKILSSVAEIDRLAKVSICGYYKDSTVSSNDIYDHFTAAVRNLEYKSDLERKYNNIRQYFYKGRPYGSSFNYSRIVSAIANGYFDHDIELLKKLIEFRLSSSSLSITLTCNDLKDMRKLKLFGVTIEEVRFHIKDRKEVLEYFENY